MGSSNLIGCLFDFVFGGSASPLPLGFLRLPPLLDEIAVGHEGFFGVGLGFGFDPGQGFGLHPELQLLTPSFDVGFEPGAVAEHFPMLPAVYELLGDFPFGRVIHLHVKAVEAWVALIVQVLEGVDDVRLFS